MFSICLTVNCISLFEDFKCILFVTSWMTSECHVCFQPRLLPPCQLQGPVNVGNSVWLYSNVYFCSCNFPPIVKLAYFPNKSIYHHLLQRFILIVFIFNFATHSCDFLLMSKQHCPKEGEKYPNGHISNYCFLAAAGNTDGIKWPCNTRLPSQYKSGWVALWWT